MASPTPLEIALLTPARVALDAASTDPDGRLDVLADVADLIAGRASAAPGERRAAAAAVHARIVAAGVPGPLAVASLATPKVDAHAQRTTGAYYTDFRLASHLAAGALSVWDATTPVIDPASGTGTLLTALALALPAGERRDRAVAELFCAADLDRRALRGAAIALRAAVDDRAAADAFATRARCQDSLVSGVDGWAEIGRGFGLVVANPPWEKLKVTRHELLRQLGIDRHYGHDVDEDPDGLAEARERMERYAADVGERTSLQGGGEVDLYKLFLALALDLAPSGALAMYLPAGLIRSSGTRELREHLLAHAGSIAVEISDNKARYFAIDTRFKFLALTAKLGGARAPHVTLRHLAGDDGAARVASSAQLPVGELREIRPDLTMPEVRSPAEWRLFRAMSRRGERPDDPRSPWAGTIVREVDMSRERRWFERDPSAFDDLVGVVEGRMVHQFTHAFKRHESGTGRSAKWAVTGPGGPVKPQFWIRRADLPGAARKRVDRERVGFCDITGQTNERAMLASRVPAGLVCGNKVPTIRFDDDTDEALGERAWLWLAMVNSLSFDWLLRRVMTTTVNYFLLRSVPLPSIDPGTAAASRLVDLVRQLDRAAHEPSCDPVDLVPPRAEIDARIALAYQLTDDDLALVLADFPLLDRGQPAIRGERRSTVTADTVRLARFEVADETPPRDLHERVAEALAVGAVAFTPAEAARSARNAAV